LILCSSRLPGTPLRENAAAECLSADCGQGGRIWRKHSNNEEKAGTDEMSLYYSITRVIFFPDLPDVAFRATFFLSPDYIIVP
jgi:hypothetical protein